MNLDLLHLRPALPLEANICEYTNKGDFTCESEKQFDSTYQNIDPHSILKTMAQLDILLNDKNKNSKSLKGRHVCCSMNFSIVEFSTRLRFDSDSEPPFSLIRIVDCMVWPS